MVMNIGERPTMADGGGVTVEVQCSPGRRHCLLMQPSHLPAQPVSGARAVLWTHSLLKVQVHVFDHKFASDFYGLDMVVLICGFLVFYLRSRLKGEQK